jgi:spore germination protein YaaH
VGSIAPPVPGASPTPSPVPTPTIPRVRSLADEEVYAFLPYWELSTAREAIDLDRLTTLAWFGVEAGKNGRLIWKQNGSVPPGAKGWRDQRWRSLMAEAQAKGVRVVLTVERFSWEAGARNQTIRLLRNKDARSRLARQIRDELIESGADGVNLDFEPLPSEVRTQFTSFVRQLRRTLERATTAAGLPSMQITFDITADVDAYDVPALTADDAADAVFLMAYDFRGAGAEYAASHSPLDDPETGFDIRTTVDALLDVVDPAYAILGLPWYGRAWTTRGPEPFSPTRSGSRYTPASTSWYEDAIGIARANGRNYDPVAQTAWTVYVVKRPGCDNCPETWRQVWYDDVDGFGAKFAFAQDEGMRGVGMWALGYTGAYRGMWNVIGLRTGAISDDVAPTGTASIAAGASGVEGDLPIVTGDVTIALEAHDTGGSELAFVRIANDGTVDADGALEQGFTWPATGRVDWSLQDGRVVVPPRVRATRTPSPSGPPLQPTSSSNPDGSGAPAESTAPGGSAVPGASAEPSGAPSASPPVVQGTRSVYVQWRDVAGNWSSPIALEVWYAPDGSVMPEPTPSPPPTPAPPTATPSASAVPPSFDAPAPSELLESAVTH